MMPDKASLHLIAIEDRDYKEERIDCKFVLSKQRDFNCVCPPRVICDWR